MDYREKTFKEKFDCAATHLGVKPEQIISLKMRDTVTSYSDYRDLIESLKREAGFQCTEINNGLQGKGYLLTNNKNKIIIVEHETGMEILYYTISIAGSIASLICIVPIVLQTWQNIRGHFSRRNDLDQDIEIRRLDNNGHLREEHKHGIYEVIIGSFSSVFSEIEELMEDVKKLTLRVDRIEKQLNTKPKKKKISKK
jgi:hypothetical protein